MIYYLNKDGDIKISMFSFTVSMMIGVIGLIFGYFYANHNIISKYGIEQSPKIICNCKK